MEWRRSDRDLTILSQMEIADVAEWYPMFVIQTDPTSKDLSYGHTHVISIDKRKPCCLAWPIPPWARRYFSSEEMLNFKSFPPKLTQTSTFPHWKNSLLPPVFVLLFGFKWGSSALKIMRIIEYTDASKVKEFKVESHRQAATP